MKRIRYLTGTMGVAALAIVLAGWTWAPASAPPSRVRAAAPNVEIAEMERRSCVTCHTAFGRPDLNEAGQYYQEHGSFEGYTGELPPREGEAEPAPEPAPVPDPDN